MPLPSIASTAHTVLVAGQPWTQVASLLGTGPHDAVYTIQTDSAGAAVLRFGDGLTGRRPPTGGLIEVRYRPNGGSQGNVANAAPGLFAPATPLVIGVDSAPGGLTLTPQVRARHHRHKP